MQQGLKGDSLKATGHLDNRISYYNAFNFRARGSLFLPVQSKEANGSSKRIKQKYKQCYKLDFLNNMMKHHFSLLFQS